MTVKLYLIIVFNFKIIVSEVNCSKLTNLKPFSKYHCSGLNISDKADKYCCFWQYTEPNTNETISRCSSISESQFSNFDAYLVKKRNDPRYSPDLTIECTEDQSLYCSNVVLDEEDIKNCSALKLDQEDDMYCCRWIYKDSKNNYKKNNYCASINEFEYLNVEAYVRYKNQHPLQRYDDLTIDCLSHFLKFEFFSPIILFLFFFY